MIFENIRMAFRSIMTGKLRSGLTILGIVIGIASVIAMLAVGRGAQQSISANIEKMGSNLLIIQPGSGNRGVVQTADSQPLTMADAAALQSALGDKIKVAPEVSIRAQVKNQNKNTSTTVLGITSAYFEARNYQMAIGEEFLPEQDHLTDKICIIGKTVATALFEDGENPAGQIIRINRQPYRIVGIYQEKGATGWQDADDQILIPIQTAQNRMTGSSDLRAIYSSVIDRTQTTAIQAEIETILRRQHKLRADQDNDFRIRSQVELMESMETISKSFTILLGSIAFISLLVGGIGIMNILLVSVTERTKEIGIRKAIGAYENDILYQFLIESITLCIIGGILGILLGVGISYVVGIFSPWQPIVSSFSILLSLGVSLSVGIGFGFFPALKAARMNPVDALRHE
jgi:putative ABC transport system permease protein